MVSSHGLSCLECGEQMDQRVEHGVTIDYCPECGGVWLDPGELESLTGHRHHSHSSHSHSSHSRDIDIDIGEEEEEEEEEEGGLLDAVAGALAGGEEEEEFEEEGFEEEEF